MVRPEESEIESRELQRIADSCCAKPAGASPVSVIAAELSSRPQIRQEIALSERGVKSPSLGGEQVRGPQHQVKPAASSDLQHASRAAHVTAKAKSSHLKADGCEGCIGVWGVAREQGLERNRREPSVRSESGQGDLYKPEAKSSAAQRQSEGSIVLKGGAQAKPENVAQHNAARGKAPCGGHAATAGKREGLDGKTVPKNPCGREHTAKVQQLQRQLWAAAKQSAGRRFHALYGQICRDDILQEAWRRVRRNKGAAGIDQQSLEHVEQYGIERLLQELKDQLQTGKYKAPAVRRVYIPKANGDKRALGIPTVQDRIVQMAAKLVLEPVFEADFKPCSYGFRPKRSANQALEKLRQQGAQGGNHVLDADISDYFGSIDHDKLMTLIGRGVHDGRMLKLIRQWLQAGVMEAGEIRQGEVGTPQGGVISPLLSNIYLHVLDTVWENKCEHLGVLVRYADDFVVMSDNAQDCEEAQRRIEYVLGKLGLKLHPEKTKRVELTGGKQGFDFLGCHMHKRMSGRIWEQQGVRRYYLHRYPSRRSMKRVRANIKALTLRARCHEDMTSVIERLNPVLRGWGQYFQSGNAARQFISVDGYVVRRLRRLRIARAGRNLKAGKVQQWTREYFESLGLHRLRGTIRYSNKPSSNRGQA